jgi:hypothetical protein
MDQYPMSMMPESEDEAARLRIQPIKVPKRVTGVWQLFDRGIYGAMEPKVLVQPARLFAQCETPVATKALAAGFAKER